MDSINKRIGKLKKEWFHFDELALEIRDKIYNDLHNYTLNTTSNDIVNLRIILEKRDYIINEINYLEKIKNEIK